MDNSQGKFWNPDQSTPIQGTRIAPLAENIPVFFP
jgi:hypothetical protein